MAKTEKQWNIEIISIKKISNNVGNDENEVITMIEDDDVSDIVTWLLLLLMKIIEIINVYCVNVLLLTVWHWYYYCILLIVLLW